jgi:hypothetical protein
MEVLANLGAAIGGAVILAALLATVVFWVWSLVDAIRVGDESAFRAGQGHLGRRHRGDRLHRLGRVPGRRAAPAGVIGAAGG